MSPPPATAAASDASARRRHGTRRSPAPRVPRRVSGPARTARPRVVATGGAVALPRGGRGRDQSAAALTRRALRRLAALADHPLLDRLLTGRAWIGLIAFALIGIVFMQVSLLKLNAGIGRSIERAAVLDRQNADLRDVVSRLGSDERLQAEAAKMGLELPPAGAVTFLGRNGRRVGGDGPIALATGTATSAAPAGVGAGALAPTNTAPAPVQATPTAATTATDPTPNPTPNPTPAPSTTSTSPAPAAAQPSQTTDAPAATGGPAGGATPAAATSPATAQQP